MNKCPNCDKSVGFHYTFTSSKGVFCTEKCCDEFIKGKNMNISFDGLRRNATRSMNTLQAVIENIIDDDYIQESTKEELIEAFNESAQFVDTFNCLYDDSVEGDMNNMVDLEIKRLEDEG